MGQGTQSEKNTLEGQAIIQEGSTVASLDGKVSFVAGKDTGITGSTVTSARGIDVTAQNVAIDSATNTFINTQTYEFKQSGLSFSLGGGVVATGMNLAYDVRRAGQVSDGRLAALYGYKAFEEFKKLNTGFNGDWKSGIAISVSLGSQRNSWEAVSSATSTQGSTVASAGNVNITATGSGATDAAGKAADGSVNVVGSGVSGENITLTAAKDVNLVAADNVTTTTKTSSSSSAGIGVSMTAGSTPGFFIQGSKASGNENEAGTTHTETVVAASDTLTVKTGSDANIVGAQAKGDTVKMEIGGDLNIASQQDTDSYNERTSSAGGTIGFGMPSSISASKGKIDSDYKSVQEQSGVYAGKGGFDIVVGGNTDLKGAVIASDATPDKNKLSTGTLTYSDIQNKAEYKASGSGISLSTQLIKDGKPNLDDNNGYKAGTDGSASGTTRSAVAPGTIEVRNPEGQTQDANNLSRDTKNANGSITPIFDKEKVKEELEFQKVLQEVVTKELNKEPKPKEIAAPVAVAALGAAVWLAAGVYEVTTANGDKKIVDANGTLLGTFSKELNGYVDHLGKRVDDFTSWVRSFFPGTDTRTPNGQIVLDNPANPQGNTGTTPGGQQQGSTSPPPIATGDVNTGTGTTIPQTQQNTNPVITSSWNQGSFDSAQDSLQWHFDKHKDEVGAEDVEQYVRKAEAFKQNLSGARSYPVDGAVSGTIRYVKNGRYIDLAPDGTIVSFGAR